MKMGGALVLTDDPREAAGRAVDEALEPLGGLSPSLGVLFASPHFLDSAEDLVSAVTARAGPLGLIGCVAESVVGGPREIESAPAVSLWLAAGIGPVETFAMEFVRAPGGGAFAGHRFDPQDPVPHLMICDPFTFPVDSLLAHLNQHVPGTVVMGGLASGGMAVHQSRLFLDDRVLPHGAVGARLQAAEIHPIVSQGCRPVGSPFTVTRAEGNIIYELGGRAPLAYLQELAGSLPDRDRALLVQGVHVGRVVDEYRAERGPGDFLIRGVVGADPNSGAIVVGDDVAVGETIQFHVRDADSADGDLRRNLRRELALLGDRRAAGALLFTCNGRGSRLFEEPDHDARLLSGALGAVPIAGFFCAGELGPVGGKNFLHGFTASIAVFPEAEAGLREDPRR